MPSSADYQQFRCGSALIVRVCVSHRELPLAEAKVSVIPFRTSQKSLLKPNAVSPRCMDPELSGIEYWNEADLLRTSSYFVYLPQRTSTMGLLSRLHLHRIQA